MIKNTYNCDELGCENEITIQDPRPGLASRDLQLQGWQVWWGIVDDIHLCPDHRIVFKKEISERISATLAIWHEDAEEDYS